MKLLILLCQLPQQARDLLRGIGKQNGAFTFKIAPAAETPQDRNAGNTGILSCPAIHLGITDINGRCF